MSRRRDPRLMLLAASCYLAIGLLYVALPGGRDTSFHRGIGGLWLLTGGLWLAAWWKASRRERSH